LLLVLLTLVLLSVLSPSASLCRGCLMARIEVRL